MKPVEPLLTNNFKNKFFKVMKRFFVEIVLLLTKYTSTYERPKTENLKTVLIFICGLVIIWNFL